MLNVVTMTDLWKQNVDGYLPVLMEIYNPDITWSAEEKSAYGQEDSYIRLIADVNRVVYKGKTYLPCAFDYTPPELDGKKVSGASLSISALDSRVKKLLRMIKLPSEVSIVSMFCKMEKDGSTGNFIYRYTELNSKPFVMNSAGSNKTTATFNLTFSKDMTRAIPFDVATVDRTPGTKG